MSEHENLVEMGYAFHYLRESVFRSAIQTLQFLEGSCGLDAGCSIGLQTLMLAEVVGANGHVTGLDLSAETLSYAADIARQSGLSDRVSFQTGNVQQLPFDDDTFDWAWSVDCVGYIPIEPSPLVQELARVVKPSGYVAILAWSSEKLLPGYPLLEAQLSGTSAGIAPFVKGKHSSKHFLRGLGRFRDVGLEACSAHTFVGDAFAPLSEDCRKALSSLFEMRWPGVQSELTQEAWHEYQRVCLPESPDFILDCPDYYAFFTYSMFRGKVAGA